MEPTTSVSGLIPLLRAEDKSVRDMAASLIWQRYFRELLDLARRNLGTRVRRRVDEEDIVVSMFDSFCARQARGEHDLADRDELWRLLVTITLRKASNARRNHHRAKRTLALEQSVATHDDQSSCPGWALEQMDGSTPSPAEAAVLNESLERRLESLGDPELRQIALWRLEGYTNREIADRIKRTERAVERRMERIRLKWSVHDDETV
jgi:DNA-directed RNA polymerase specialized sigma24 family protein